MLEVKRVTCGSEDLIQYTMSTDSFSGVGSACAGDKSAPPKVLIWWKSGKNLESPGKMHGNLGKISENLRNVCTLKND